ncbi:hypothetical protein SHIRM173S_10202 [Streptomyces hirsutus]
MPCGYGRAVTFAITGRRGGESSTPARVSANRRDADAMSREWNAALTGSGTRRTAGSAAVSRRVTADTPWGEPEITTCVGALSLAISTSSRPESARTRSTSVRPVPMTAAMARPRP